MTVSVPTYTEKTWQGDGVTTVFSFQTRVDEAADLEVYFVENDTDTLKSLSTHYSLDGLTDPAGVTVTLTAAATADQQVKVRRSTIPKQTINYSDLGKVPGDTTEALLDRLAMAMQDLKSRVDQVETLSNAAALIEDFDKRYLGAFAADPTTDNDGEALLEGALYFNTVSGLFRVWGGINWSNQSTALANGEVTEPKHATGGVSTRALADLSVTVDKLGNLAVTEPKLAAALALTLPNACYSIAEMQALNTARYHVACLALAGRDGMFTWSSDASAALVGAGIASSAVNSTTETITSVAHGLVTGQAVLVTTAVNGLSVNTLYYAIRVDADNFRLASTFALAKAGTAFNLTGSTAMTVKRHADPRMGIYVTPSSDLSGASGAWVRQHNSPFNAKWWDLKGTGATDDDTHALQAAIFFTEGASLRQLFIPSHNISAYYQVTASLIVTKPIWIIGEHPMMTIGGVGLASGRYIIEADGQAFQNFEQLGLFNMTVRTISGSGGEIKFDRVANIIMRDSIIWGGAAGMLMTGNRSYGNVFENVHFTSVSGSAVVYDAFTGGGQHNWIACSFNGASGMVVNGNSELSSLNLDGCAFEGCAQPIELKGIIHGVNFDSLYFEKNGSAGSSTIRITPDASKVIRAVKAFGGYYETDAENDPFLIGGAGVVSGVTISTIETDGYARSIAWLNNNGSYTVTIASMYVQNLTAIVGNGPFTNQSIAMCVNAAGTLVTS